MILDQAFLDTPPKYLGFRANLISVQIVFLQSGVQFIHYSMVNLSWGFGPVRLRSTRQSQLLDT